MNFKNIILGFVLIFGSNALAQHKKWTLKECVEYAFEHNISIKNAALDVEDATTRESDAFGNFLPSFNSSMGHSWRIGRNDNPITGILENQTNQFSNVGISSSVDIFRGLQNLNTLKRSRLNKIAMQYKIENIKDNISINVANSYMQVLFSRENLEIANAQYLETEQDLKRTRALVDNGVVPKGDLLNLEATIASRQQQIVNSENALLLAKISLAQLLLIEDYENFDIAEENFIIPSTKIMEKSADEIYKKALTFRNDIKLSETNLDIAEIDLKLARGALLPRLTGNYNMNSNISYADRRIGTSNNMPVFAPPLPIEKQLDNNLGHSISLSLSIPIFNGFSVKNRIKRQQINLERVKNNYSKIKLDLSNEVYGAWNNTKLANKAYEVATKTVVARKEALKYAKQRFEVGLMNSFDYTQAQSRLNSAKSEMIKAKYDYIFSLKILEFYFGISIN